jgi:hypothetical protein
VSLNITNLKKSDYDDIERQAIFLPSLSKDTFWLASRQQPRCLLEAYVHEILMSHLTSLDDIKAIDPETSGAEWWVQVKQAGDQSNQQMKQSNSQLNGNDIGIDLHYDKDEELARLFGVGVFPLISTVTYVSKSREVLPTIIFQATTSEFIGTPIRSYIHSNPKRGKHIAFDGRLLHGAPYLCEEEYDEFEEEEFEDEELEESNKLMTTEAKEDRAQKGSNYRVTLLVNIWKNHRPLDVEVLPPIIVETLNNMIPYDSSKKINLEYEPGILNEVGVSKADVKQKQKGDWVRTPFVSKYSTWGKSEDEASLSLRYWRPSKLQNDETKSIRSYGT